MGVSAALTKFYERVVSNLSPRLLQRWSSTSSIHSFNEEEIREKLQAFPGGSIDLLKQESGIAVLTINNSSRMNAFSGMILHSEKKTTLFFLCDNSSSFRCTLSLRQHDGGARGQGQPAGELDRWQRCHRCGCCWNVLLWIRPQCCQGHIKPTGIAAHLFLTALLRSSILSFFLRRH